MIQYMFASVPIGERVFIGALNGLIIGICIYLYRKHKNKNALKEYEKEVQKEIISDSKTTVATDNPRIPLQCYSTLLTELKEKCNPALFLEPYDAEKVEISNGIYAQLDRSANDLQTLIKLRNLAITKLGISFSATELYEKLSEAYNPRQYVGEHYDADKLHVANQIYSRIQNNKDNIIELERIAQECGIGFVGLKENQKEDQDNGNLPTGTKDNHNDEIWGTIFVIIIVIWILICAFWDWGVVTR